MIITRKQIIKAIKTEPLRAGRFVHLHSRDINNKCCVCAVGAVLRSCHMTDIDISKKAADIMYYHNWGETSNKVIKHTLTQKNWLVALSNKFETLCYKHGMNYAADSDFIRNKLVRWVYRSLPKTMDIDV